MDGKDRVGAIQIFTELIHMKDSMLRAAVWHQLNGLIGHTPEDFLALEVTE